jgi:hypothetical protein
VLVAAAALAAIPTCAFAQAFTPPDGVGSVTTSWQWVSNTGHRLSDGLLREQGQSVTTSVLVESEYGFTDRLSATLGLPYVFAKYTGANPPISGLPIDTCRCWQSAFQDLSASVRYRFGSDTWAVTPTLGYGLPSHDYRFAGEAVVGRNLNELHVGVSSGLRLVHLLPKATMSATYIYSFVEKPIDTIDIDRSNLFMDFGYALTSRLYVRGGADVQRTHGGLRFGSPTGDPFPPPGEINTPLKNAQRDRLLKSNYWHASFGASFDAGPVDLFGSFTKYLNGTDTHNGQLFTFGMSWYFDLRN